MSESIVIDSALSKQEKYAQLLPQAEALIKGEVDAVANAANLCAMLKQVFDFFWIGIYFVKQHKGKQQLVLGPFQGPVACTRIELGKGVCGTAWQQKKTIVVPDVDKFEGHIVCSSHSRSEIVVPVLQQDVVVAVIDVDSEQLNHFDETDKYYLEKISSLYSETFSYAAE